MNKILKTFATVLLSMIVFLSLLPVASMAASFFYVDDSGNVGIGNSAPASKLDVSGAMYSRLVTISDSSSVTLNWNSGNVQSIHLNAANTAFTFSNGQAGGKYDLIIGQDVTGGRLITWPASVLWPGGTEPILTSTSNATDTVSFIYDGNNYLGTYATNFHVPTLSVSIDAISSGSASSNSVTVSHTVSGSNPILFVAVWAQDSGADTITGVTYNSVSLTQVAKINGGHTGDSLYLYKLTGPAAGAHNIVVSANTSANLIEVGGVSYDGAAQSGQPDASTTGGATSGNTSVTTTLTTPNDNDWKLMVSKETNVPGQSAGAGTTMRNDFSGNATVSVLDSNGPIHPAGSTALQAVLNSGTAAFDTIMVSIKP